ncbi:MAG: hypothetical protein SF029_20600 [bacterium]|nr:hypothetical protein [bacterium]
MLSAASQHPILARYLARRRTLLLIDSLPLAMVAADVAAVWGVVVDETAFHNRDVADVVAEFERLTTHERTMLEWAIVDNINAYCAWTPAPLRNLATAARWPLNRPAYLNPLRYKYPNRARRGASRA